MKHSDGITRDEILRAIPYLRPGSFNLFLAKARVDRIGVLPSAKKHNVNKYLYPLDSVERIKSAMNGKGKK